ncbi:Helicase associated domain protein, partial [bacterium]|nr:Helicase associated domain protein [bacterium]
RLFTTATPRYFGKAIKDASKAADLAVIGMDDETVFGPVIHQLTFGQAIQDELLNDYQVVIVGVDEPMVKQWIDNYEIVATNPDETTDARTLAAKIGMLKAVKDYDLKRVISFHSRVSGAKKFSEELTEVADLIEPVNRPEGTFLSDYVSGAMKAGDRKDKIDKLKELEGYDRGILTNARCLAEGVDVPSLDGVAFIDPKGSQVEIIQAVGRAIRKVRGAKVQTKGTIVIPVFIEDDDNHEASIEASNFKPVWDVLKALRAHDEVLADVLDTYRTNMAKDVSQARENISDKIVFDLPMSVDTEFATALRTVLVEASTASWEFWFGLLEQYKEREGHCRVPVDLEINHHKIGNWAAHQRNPKTKLSSDRKLRLDELGFVWDPFSEAWEIGFTSLLKFQRLEGHCNVPQHYELDGTKLGHWVRSQRKAKNGMSLARKKRLSELGFIWDVPTQIWEEGFAKLVQFWEEKGHCIVPQRIEIEGFKLGNWCVVQMRNKNSMLPERKQRLDNIGFIWSPLEQQWENGLDLLLRFKEIEGHCNVHAKYKINDFNLGTWVSTQRENQDNLSTERKQRLDDIGFVWDPFSEAWEKGFEKLSQFKETKGHCRVAWDFKTDEFNLYEWVRSQRKTKDKMPPERKQRLDDIGFIWDVTKDKI